jgi:DNA-binding transcriptional MerR regulator
VIPEKHFYTIGDVCKLTGIKPHILRYWEEQFKILKPARRYSGHRKYTRDDIDLINRVRFLIVDRKFTLAGAKREINRLMAPKTGKIDIGTPILSALPLLNEIKKEVDDCLAILGPAPEDEIAEALA